MLSSAAFTYDGIASDSFGLLISEIGGDNFQQTSPFVSAVKAIKTPGQKRFFYTGRELDDMPQKTFSVFSADGSPISDIVQRDILSWIADREGFKELQFIQPDLIDYTYKCIFSQTEKQFHRGNVVGFIFTAAFDSVYAYGTPRKKVINGVGPAQTVKIINESDVKDSYVYPIITLKSTSAGTNFITSIINLTDDATREFKFVLRSNEKVVIDNELKIITADGSHRLADFNKNWLRLVKGVNELKISIIGSVTIEVPTYVLIGF